MRFRGELGMPILFGIVFFFIVCLSCADTIKTMVMIAAVVAVLFIAVRFRVLRDRLSLTFLLLTLYVVMDGVSTFYAVSGKFALREFLKVFMAYLLAVILLAASRKNEETAGKRIATILAVCAAVGSLVSIDLISTRWISGAVVWLLGRFTETFQSLEAVETGTRIKSLFSNPNTFAGFAGIGVLLSLGLTVNSGEGREKTFNLVLLYVSSLGFLLAFSLGASAFIALAFLVLLALIPGEKRAGMLIVMLETLILVAVSAALISRTSFNQWDGVQPIPLACTLLGAAVLCLLDRFVGRRIAERLSARGKMLAVLIVVLVLLAAMFLAVAWNWTGEATLAPGESLRRSAYLNPGDYTLSLQAEGTLNVTIESQNQRETMMHTETRLYAGAADDASFTVPEDSLVVYFTFRAPDGARIAAAQCGGEKIPLRYKLLPGFIANRLQGLSANENAIQRLVFFRDGIKLFRRSPMVGLGMGAFENAIKSTQSFYYETKYAHNHYIQTLLETGIIGLALFVLLLISSLAAVWKSRRKHPYAPMLGAALVFMFGHAATEVVFSSYAYLPMAFGVFALISYCCEDAVRLRQTTEKTIRTVVVALAAAGTVVYCFFLAGNMMAKRQMDMDPTMQTLVRSASLDKFEWADYALPYVVNAQGDNVNLYVRQQADQFAERLAKEDSNTIPIYLAQYYFDSGRPEQGFAMVEKYVKYVSSDPNAWNRAFALLREYADDSETFRSGVARIAQILETWNAENMGDIQLDEETREFLAAYL